MTSRIHRMIGFAPRITATAALCTALLTFGGCSRSGDSRTPPEVTQTDVPFRSDGSLEFLREDDTLATVEIEIADSDSARTRGLMQRSSLRDGTGMLFVFPVADYQSFWMANTQISLDIIFVSTDSTVVDVHKYTRPLSSDNVGGQQLSRFVVEVPAGFADTYGIVEGDKIAW